MWWFLFACAPVDEQVETLDVCDADPVEQISACLVSESGIDFASEDTGTARWKGTGVVQEVGVGACDGDVSLGHFGPYEDVSWARVEVDGATWKVGLGLPGWSLPIGVGDTLDVAWDSALGDFTEGRLALRDGDGALLAWAVNTWSADAGPPELAVAPEQAATCATEDERAAVRRFGLVAGASVVAPGEAADVDGWRVHNVDITASERFDCDDCPGWWARYAVTRP